MLDDLEKNMQSRNKLHEGKIVEKDKDISINFSSGWSKGP